MTRDWPHRRSHGFTLVELMIVVAIIGVLAAIGIPLYVEMQVRARAAEGPLNVDGLETALAALVGQQLNLTTNTTGFYPVAGKFSVDKTLHAWAPTNPAWPATGWSPDGEVRCTYWAAVEVATWPVAEGKLTWAQVICNVDGDDTFTITTKSRTLTGMVEARNCYKVGTGDIDCSAGGPYY